MEDLIVLSAYDERRVPATAETNRTVVTKSFDEGAECASTSIADKPGIIAIRRQ